jgi:hypothetical protein
MDNQNSIKNLKLQKVNLALNTRAKVIYSEENDTECYYAAANKIINLDYKSNTVLDKFKIGKKNIHKFNIFENSIYALSDGEFHEFNMKTRKITKSFKHEKIIQNFIFSKVLNSFLLITDSEILIVDRNFTILKQKNLSHNLSIIVSINNEGNKLLLTEKNNLLILNLLTFDVKIMNFVKNITAAIYAGSDIVIGDAAGKMHFIYPISGYITSTKHWHSHRVTCLETDKSEDTLYSAGDEGVIVSWNLRNEKKSYLPRLQPLECISIANDSQVISVSSGDNSIKFINLFNNSVLSQVYGLNAKTDLTYENYNDFILFTNKNSSKVQFLNKKTSELNTNDNISNRNFISRTEREEINLRKLEIVKVNSKYMVTYEEVKDDMLFISYLKLWSRNNFDFTLLTTAENSHNNEKIKNIFLEDDSFITYSDKSLKYWNITGNIFACSFVGTYREENTTLSDIYANKRYIYSVHNNYLVEWSKEMRNVNNIYAFEKKLTNLNGIDGNLIVYNNECLHFFNTDLWEITSSETCSEIKKVYVDKQFFILVKRGEYHLVLRWSEGAFNKSWIIKKKNIKFIDFDVKTNSFVIMNHNNELFTSAKSILKNTFIGKKNPSVAVIVPPTHVENGSYSPINTTKYEDLFEQTLKKLKHK